MNFIFDLGNVLVYYTPEVYLRGLFSDEDLVNKLFNTIFKSPEWLEMDRGNLTHDEATDIFCARQPQLEAAICRTMQNFDKTFTPIHETIELLPKIKDLGHNIYYLSNIHQEIRDQILAYDNFFDLFEGGVFSCDIHYIKPSPEIYRHLIDKYKLIPGECIFFDDMKENAAAAEKEGMKGVQFSTAECVLDFM